jgi:DNA-binding response OmpR family regulator
MEKAKRPQSRSVPGSERYVDPVERLWSAGEQRPSAFSPKLSPDSSLLGVILAIDDDPRILTTLQRLFTMEGYEVRKAPNGSKGLDAFISRSPDAVILDLMLPDMSGREICKLMKQNSPHIPVIILTAISDVADKVLLLETGADDYITKPFSPRELLARVQAAIRRSKRLMPQDWVTFGDIQLDFASMRATKKGRPVALTAFEFKLIRFFLNNPERVITREELLSAVWGYTGTSFTQTVDNQILKLRQRLEDDPVAPVHFCTVHEVGYRFVPKPGMDSKDLT